MKWFKHLSGSLNNSDIFEAIERFGSDGYLVFFGTLELMADEFDPNNPGIYRISTKKLTKNLQLSRQKTVKILKYFHEKERIFIEDHGEFLLLNCPRLADLSDEYTVRQLKKVSGQTPDPCRDKLQPIEVEVEVDKTINKQSIVYEDEKFKEIPEKLLAKWKQVAPGINIQAEIKKAELWLISNPDKKRSKWGAFLSNWMVRAQENYIKYGGGNGKGIRTNRSDPRDRALQSRTDAEVEAITRQWESSQAFPGGDPGRTPGNDDVPDFFTSGEASS